MDSDELHIFQIYRRYCHIRSVKTCEEGSEDLQNEGILKSKSSKDELAQLQKFVELKVHPRISVFDELHNLMWKLNLMVDFSEFSRFYDFVFFFCRQNGQKNITVSMAITAWRLVLAGRFRLLNQWCNFVQNNQRHNISEDMWQQVLAFSRCVHENLEGYDPEGAWPVLIDEFVEHMYRELGSSKDTFVCNCGESDSESSIEDLLPGLKVSPGLKRKLPSLEDEEMEFSYSPSSDSHNFRCNVKKSRHNNEIVPVSEDNRASGGDCMDIAKPLGCTKSHCSVERCLSKGFAGLFSSGPYLQLDQKRGVSSYT